jgi:hypothetical protein
VHIRHHASLVGAVAVRRLVRWYDDNGPFLRYGKIDLIEDDGRVRQLYDTVHPALELGAVIVAETGDLPTATIPHLPYELAAQAIDSPCFSAALERK